MEAPGKLLAGEIGKPFGLNGEVYLVRISDDPHRFDDGAQLTHANGRLLTVEHAHPHGNRWLVKFRDVDDRDGAEELRGAVFVASNDVRALDDDEYWPHDLVGCTVAIADSGPEVGTVARIVPGAAQDLLAVTTEDGERLIPVVKEIVVAVDIANRRIQIDPPAGLLD